MIRRLAAGCLVLAAVAAGCNSDLGRAVPFCADPRDVQGAHILQAQAVQTADLVPCLNDLQPGWEYQHLEAENDRSRFRLESPTMGEPFLEVILTHTCDASGAVETPTNEPGTRMFIDIEPMQTAQRVIVVPANARLSIPTRGLIVEYSQETARGKDLVFQIDERQLAVSDRVAEAHAAGLPVVVIRETDVREKTVEVILPGRGPRPGLTPDEAGSVIGDFTDQIRYRGSWYYTYQGGCTEYRFDAHGADAITVADDAAEAIGFFDMVATRQIVRGIADLLPGPG
jgi:hypothetical protein